ncbi:MAG: GNVR domain-containing protein [Hyphomicrobiales bacterium]|nr:GNVR domain-containing protein [Hyphomicrobiales bacterium]
MASDSQLQEVPLATPGGDNGESLDLQRFYTSIYRGRYIIGSIVFISLSVLALYYLISSEKYQATAQILIDIQKPQLVNQDLAMTGLDMTRQMIGPVTDSQVEILQSTRLAELVIRSTGLQNDPAYSGGSLNPLSRLFGGRTSFFSSLWGGSPKAETPPSDAAAGDAPSGEDGAAETVKGDPQSAEEMKSPAETAKGDTQSGEEGAAPAETAKGDTQSGEEGAAPAETAKGDTQSGEEGAAPEGAVEDPIPTAVIDKFLYNLNVNRKGLTLVLLVRFTDSDPVRAAVLANAVAEAYLEDQREERVQVTRQMSRQVQRRMTDLRDQVLAAQRRVEEFREANNLHIVGGLTVSEREIAETVTQLIVARNEAANKRTALQQMEIVAADPSAVMSISPVLESPVVRDLRRQAAEVSRKLATVITQFGENDNQAITARAELRDVRNEIGLEIQRILQSARNDYEIAKSRVEFFEQDLKRLMKQFAETNRLLIKLSELEREANVTRDVYISLLSRQKETNVRAGILYPDARIFDYASVPRHPAGPRKIIVLGLTLFGSLAIGLSLVILRDHIVSVMRRTPQVSADAEEIAPYPGWRRRSA